MEKIAYQQPKMKVFKLASKCRLLDASGESEARPSELETPLSRGLLPEDFLFAE
jgi:hypothetical protein